METHASIKNAANFIWPQYQELYGVMGQRLHSGIDITIPPHFKPSTLKTYRRDSLSYWCIEMANHIINQFRTIAAEQHGIPRAPRDQPFIMRTPRYPFYEILNIDYYEIAAWYSRFIDHKHPLHEAYENVLKMIVSETEDEMFDVIVENFPKLVVAPTKGDSDYYAVMAAYHRVTQKNPSIAIESLAALTQ